MRIKISTTPTHHDLPLPQYQTAGAAGMDIIAANEQDIVIAPGKYAAIPTGICIALEEGFEAQVRPRSGMAAKYGVTVLNAPGTVDCDYRGEISVLLINHGENDFAVKRGMRIAQLVITPVLQAEWELCAELVTTDRGSGGFGHTGI